MSKQIFRLLLFLVLLPVNLSLLAKDEAPQINAESVSGIGLNENRFFRFNNNIKLSFDVSLQRGYEQYLEYLVRISDINKQEVNIILSIQNNTPSELLIISKNKLSKHIIGVTKEEFLNNKIPFDFLIDLKSDQLTINVKDTVLIENRVGLRPHTDYKIIVGVVSDRYKSGHNVTSAIQLSNLSSDPDLLGTKKEGDKGNSTLLWVIVIIILDILIFGYIIVKKGKQRKLRLEQAAVADEKELITDEDIIFHPETDINKIIKADKSAIFLFKQFEVLDKDGNDISSRFSPLLKELFLILLLYSQIDSKGINTGQLKDMLWFDKEQQSANNNRAVNIGKLKSILDRVGGYDIISTPNNIRIEFKEDIFCDYIRVLSLLHNVSLNKEQILELVAIVRRGPFLPECNYEWLDSFKAEISDKLIDNLLNLAELPNIKEDDKLSVQIADTIFNFDNLNEKALVIKCIALTNMGKRSIANINYNRFVKEYESIYATPYPVSFSEILNLPLSK